MAPVFDSAVFDSSVFDTGGGLLISVSDSTTVTENVLVLQNLFINVSDASTLAEHVNVLVTNPNDRIIQVGDDSTVTESVTVRVGVTPNVSDASTLTESVTVRMLLLITVFESSTLSESVTPSIPQPPPEIDISSTTIVTESVTVHFGIDAVHTITITGSLEPFSQFHSIRINPAAIQSYSNRDIQKPTGQVIRT